MPLPETGGDELEALLHGELAQEAQVRATRIAAPKRNSVTGVEHAILDRASQPPVPKRVNADVAAPPIDVDTARVEEIEVRLQRSQRRGASSRFWRVRQGRTAQPHELLVPYFASS